MNIKPEPQDASANLPGFDPSPASLSSVPISEETPEEAAEFDGLDIDSFAKAKKISPSEVWSMLRRGELIGRTERGQIRVYTSMPPTALFDAVAPAQIHGAVAAPPDLPPLPFEGLEPFADLVSTTEEARAQLDASATSFPALTEEARRNPELALLLDHLSLAKEENREILKLTQDSLTRISSLTDTIIAMKDLLIKTKEDQVSEMRDLLDAKTSDLKRLRQENADLETLVRTLSGELKR